MKALKYLFITLLIMHSFTKVWAQHSTCQRSTEGTDFWFAFMENRAENEAHFDEITLSSSYECNYEITIGKINKVVRSGTLKPDSVERIILDRHLIEASGSDVSQNRAIHLTSDMPLRVYAYNYTSLSSDVAVVFPTYTLGKKYYTMCYEPSIKKSDYDSYIGRNSEFLIVATEDNTKVEVTPSVKTTLKRSAHVTFVEVMSKGEILQIQSKNDEYAEDGEGDLTGSYISADKPVAVFSGSCATAVPKGFDITAHDHLFEQMPPISTWGKKFLAIPFKSRFEDIYRIMAAYDSTFFKVGNKEYFIAQKGDYIELSINYEQPKLIESSKPVLVAQYSCSNKYDDTFTNGNGDPSMIILNYLGQTMQQTSFMAYNSSSIKDRFFVNVVIERDSTTQILLDGEAIQFNIFSDSVYSYAQLDVSKGLHHLVSTNPNKGFIAYVYAFGGLEAYSYPLGYNYNFQMSMGDDFIKDTLSLCIGDTLHAELYYESYQWNTGDSIMAMPVFSDGTYWVKGITIEGCEFTDSVVVNVDDRDINLGEDSIVCNVDQFVLDAGNGFVDYLWNDGSSEQIHAINSSGTYTVHAKTPLGCNVKDSIYFVFFNPVFTPDYPVVTIDYPDIRFLSEIEGADSYLWDFGDGETSTASSPSHHYNNIGEYEVSLVATASTGCSEVFSQKVKVIPLERFTPNAFRPSSNIPENRVFIPVSSGVDPDHYTLRILNRYGSVVFESGNPEKGWDGSLSNGGNAEPGMFIWVVAYKDIQGHDHQQKGTVTLVR